MSFLQKIRSKSHAEKVRFIWIVVGVTITLLVLIWIFTSRITGNSPKDMSLFKTIQRGLKDVGKQYQK